MLKGNTKNRVRMTGVALLLIVLAAIIPGAAEKWYQIGMGLYYDKELEIAGLTHQQSVASASHNLRVETAKRNGIIYSSLMVNSTYLPLFFFALSSVIIFTTPLTQTVNKKLLIVIPVIFIWGTFFSGLSHIMISSIPKMSAFLGASIIWLGVTAIASVLLFVGLSIRRVYAKKKSKPM